MSYFGRFVPCPLPTLYEKEHRTEYLANDTLSQEIRENPADFLKSRCHNYMDVIDFATAMGVIEEGEVYLRLPDQFSLTTRDVTKIYIAIFDFERFDRDCRIYDTPVQLAREFCYEWDFKYCMYCLNNENDEENSTTF